MVRHSRRRGEAIIQKPTYDHEAMFVETARKTVRNSALLDAYRKSTGLLLMPNQATASQLRAAAKASSDSCPYYERFNEASAMAHAGKRVLGTYVRDWWTAILCREPPETLEAGAEFFSFETIRGIIERRKSIEPDLKG